MLIKSSAQVVQGVNPRIAKKGLVLSSLQADDRIKQVSKEEVDNAIMSIHNFNALGADGWNTAFFKKVWSIINTDIYKVVMHFFNHYKLDRKLNLTFIALIL